MHQDASVPRSKRTDMQARAGLVGSKAESFFRARAFEVTGVLLDDVLNRTKRVLLDSLAQDKTSGQVLFELDQELADYLPERDAQGNLVNVPARIETIARTNTALAVNQGRYAAMTDPDLEGFVEGFQYSAVLDDRTRDTHRAWDNVTRPENDQVWFSPDRRPPNGFNCRCLLVPVTAADETEMTPDDELPLREAGPEVFPDRGFK